MRRGWRGEELFGREYGGWGGLVACGDVDLLADFGRKLEKWERIRLCGWHGFLS